MKADRFFARNPVFTQADFVASRSNEAGSSERTPQDLLRYYVDQGHLVRVRRGLYAVVPPGADPATLQIDAYLLASKMAEDAVLGYHTALELHGVAYSSSDRLLYLTRRETTPVTFRGLSFRSVLVPKALRDRDEDQTEVTVVDRSGLDVRVTTLERTLVDTLDRLDLGGGWEEVWRSLESVSYYDLTRVVDYALLLGNKTTVAKVGFFLDQHRDALSVEHQHLDRLQEHIPRQPHYLKGSRDAPNVLLSRWHIVVPESVAERVWGSVL